jgi:hypothetical protein
VEKESRKRARVEKRARILSSMLMPMVESNCYVDYLPTASRELCMAV